MKKFILGTAAIILLLFLIFSGWLYYRKYKSFQVPIHKDAETIVRINVDAILKTLAFDLVTSSGKYSKKENQKEVEQKLETGLELTANVLLYTLNNHPENIFLGYLKISDKDAFKRFLVLKLGIDTFKVIQKGITSASTEKLKLKLLFSDKEVVFAFSPVTPYPDLTSVMLDVIQHKNIISSSSNTLNKLKDLGNHISFLNKNGQGSIDFADGEMALLATFSFGSLNIPDKIFHKNFDKESAVKGWLEADLSALLPTAGIQIKDRFQFHLDSLTKYGGQHIELEISKTVRQKDSMVTYTYGDNFEKVEEIAVEEKNVPGLYLTFKNSAPLLPYLQHQKVLDEKLKVSKEVFPLFDLYASEKGEYVELSSNETNTRTINPISSKHFIYLSVDFNKIRDQHIFPSIDHYIDVVDSLMISGRKVDKKTGEIKATIYLADRKINGLRQLISVLF